MERRHSAPLPSQEGLRSSSLERREGFVGQDPRRFKFAIICKKCDLKFATMQEARAHFHECSPGKSVDVQCGHCEMRTSLWSAMCAHLNQAGMQKQVACRPEYRMMPPQRVEFPQVTPLMQPPASPPAVTVSGHSADVRLGVGGWRDPIPLTLSPSRQEARDQRHAQLRSTLRHWERKHPSRTEPRGVGREVPVIPLESVKGHGYRLPAAAAGSAKGLTPASPEAYSPPREIEGPWTITEPLGLPPVVGRVSPRVMPQPPLGPTVEEGGAVNVATIYQGACFDFLENPMEMVGPPGVSSIPEMSLETLGLAAEQLETPPPTLSGSRKRTDPLRTSDILEEAVTVARILQEPELSDILRSPMSAFSPPTVVPQVKPEPVEVVEILDSPPRKCMSPVGAPIDYKRAYEELQNRCKGHMTQLHFWAEIVGGLGVEGARLPTPQERARRQRLISVGYWPAWMTDVIDAPLSVLGERFRVYYGALLHEGGPRF